MKNFLCQVMYFRTRNLFLQATHNWRCEHYIANRRKSYDEEFHEEDKSQISNIKSQISGLLFAFKVIQIFMKGFFGKVSRDNCNNYYYDTSYNSAFDKVPL